MDTLSMSVGRDYRTTTKYEYVIFAGETVVSRKGFYPTYTQAKAAGLKNAAELSASMAKHDLDGLAAAASFPT